VSHYRIVQELHPGDPLRLAPVIESLERRLADGGAAGAGDGDGDGAGGAGGAGGPP
jgi:hypothetical protein